jgi:hypothetical protein
MNNYLAGRFLAVETVLWFMYGNDRYANSTEEQFTKMYNWRKK